MFYLLVFLVIEAIKFSPDVLSLRLRKGNRTYRNYKKVLFCNYSTEKVGNCQKRKIADFSRESLSSESIYQNEVIVVILRVQSWSVSSY